MKSFHYLLLGILFLAFPSCQKSVDDELNLQQEPTASISEQTSSARVDINYSSYFGPDETTIFRNTMQWASYIAGKILFHNIEAREEVLNILSLTGNTISLQVLLGPNVDIQESAFKAQFIDHLHYYFGPNRPTHEIDLPGGGRPVPQNEIAILVDFFLTYLTVDNCVEFYFPNDLDFSTLIPTITTTAHPLSEDLFNEGFKRFISSSGLPSQTTSVTVNDDYLNLNPSIIVVRPYRQIMACPYLEYDGIVFTDFLSN